MPFLFTAPQPSSSPPHPETPQPEHVAAAERGPRALAPAGGRRRNPRIGAVAPRPDGGFVVFY